MPEIFTIILFISMLIISFISMEGVAWFLHKYVMHGFGWYLHEDHHRYSKGKFEKNDIFGLFFSLLSFFLIFTSYLNGWDIRIAIGFGVMFYGLSYFIVHDIFFHKRIKIKYKPKSDYIKRILNSHAVHHQKSSAYKGISFGFLYASKKYAVKS